MRIDKRSALFSCPIAHRGLWGDGIQENSISAFQNAKDFGFPIEIDLYGTKGGEVVVFHDHNLFRMTKREENIFDLTLDEIKQLTLKDTSEKIPTLKEVLDCVDGKVPLLIEFKTQPDKSYVKNAVEILKEYKGEFAVQSFNPLILRKIKRLAPNFIRGVLTTDRFDKSVGKISRFVVKKMPLNFLVNPDFISCDYKALPLKKRKKKSKPVLAWTITSNEILQSVTPHVDNVIFENFIPKKD